jgi:hypothetical protein
MSSFIIKFIELYAIVSGASCAAILVIGIDRFYASRAKERAHLVIEGQTGEARP